MSASRTNAHDHHEVDHGPPKIVPSSAYEEISRPSALDPIPRSLPRWLVLLLWAGLAVGVFAIFYGWLFWATNAPSPGWTTITVGFIVVAGIILLYLRARRFVSGRIVKAGLTPTGISATLANGTPLVADWRDPKLALELSRRPSWEGSNTVSFVLQWPMNRRVSYGNLTESGMGRILTEARTRGLEIRDRQFGTGPNAWTIYRIRHVPTRSP
ncbi:MAG: hypothetical protein WCB19_06880 [Thermoplasmata archaeon]